MKKYVFYFVLLFIMLPLCFDKFMTYDRSYTWSKEYKNEIEVIARKNGFKIEKTDKIPIQSIKRSFEKIIKIKIKDFGGEFGENTLLKLANTNAILNCKGWCSGDYLIGLEISYNNINETFFMRMKNDFEKQFDNYEIIWTSLPSK